MPRKPKSPPPVLPTIPLELLKQFGNGPMTAEAINAASVAFKKALIERALGAELSHHLGYPPGATKPAPAGNQRNGKGGKTVLTDDGPVRIDVLCDQDGSFEPLLIPKYERRFTGFDDKIVATSIGCFGASVLSRPCQVCRRHTPWFVPNALKIS